ncbi:transporter substrate-binding domain-containing protein [Rhodoferax sp.]|uniref:transporter substrate-binding domain-containing protein n=1 Tax=Rhodoferax sp. TaxID=50421 RepID=UPI002726DB33|nr:transporter substrate-binding domain-containing protein [Rhodoferax sp.]MDO8319414.1 transporter substrate-binding domain-containing protein [Rhodoferax sp.]
MFNWFKVLKSLSTAIAIGFFAILHAPAQAAGPQTIDDIIKKGTIVVGVSTTTPIFGLIGKNGEPEGYDPDVAHLLAKYLGVKVEFVPVTGANRIPQLLGGRVDLLISLFGITPERAQQVWFSMPYAYEAATLVAPAAVKVKTIDDLKGKRVGVPRGAMQDLLLTPLAQGKGFHLQRFDDEATELQALIAGQIDLGGTGLLVNQRLNKSDPGKDYQVKILLRPLHFGIGLRRGETDKLQWLNTFIYTIKNNGELDAISRKWRGLPLEELPVF